MDRQRAAFLAAISLFTRLPIGAHKPWSAAEISAAVGFLPLVGWLVGGLSALAFVAFSALLPTAPAVVLTLALGIVLTGAFHEDGFADSCDGLGGWEKVQILAIMKDSHIGSYGVIGLCLLLLAKASVLVELAHASPTGIVPALLVAAPLSRLAAVAITQVLPYARTGEDSKMRATTEPLERGARLAALSAGLLPLLLLPVEGAVVAVLAVLAVGIACMRNFSRRLGGYTGDLLGATQQLSELACYLALLALSSLATGGPQP